MVMKLCGLLLCINIVLMGMEPNEPAILSPKSTPEGLLLRKLVIDHLNDNEKKQAAAAPVKDEKYYKKEMGSAHRNLVNTPPVANQAQVMAGPLDIKDNKGVLCAAHSIYLINLIQNKIIKTITIPSKVEETDRHEPMPCCVKYAKIASLEEEQILIGEATGRVLIANPGGPSVNRFDKLPGKVLGFFVDPKGEKIAVRYETKDQEGKTIPCFALAAEYEFKRSRLNTSVKSLDTNMVQSAVNKRRSWAPPLTASGKAKPWSHFVTQVCNHEVTNITFEEGYCVTHCATGNIEKWTIKNIDTNPELVKVAQIE